MVRPRALGLALALLTVLLYLPVSRHDFINYDDPDYITENPVVLSGLTSAGLRWAFTTFHASNWHPVTWISHMLDVGLFGVDPGAHHMVNVLLHSVNAVLLFAFLHGVTGRAWLSVLVAALFAWHPLRVQSVAWAAERKDVLSSLFWILTLLAYWRYSLVAARFPAVHSPSGPGSATGDPFRWYGLTLVTLAAGLMSKPMLVTVPFVLLLLDYWPLRRPAAPFLRSWTTLVLEKWPFFLLSLASCVVTWMAQRAEAVVALERLSLGERLANAVVAYGGYLLKAAWPTNLSVLYPLPSGIDPLRVGISLTLLTAITVLAYRFRRGRPHVLVGWLWYLGTLVPVIGLVQVGGQAMADRYTYVPMIGVVWAAVWEVAYAAGRWPKRVGAGIALGLLTVWCALNLNEQRYWQNSETLFARAVAVTQDNAVAHSNLGLAYETKGELETARRHYERAVQLHAGLSQARNNLAGLLVESGRVEEALPHFEQALRLKPHAWQTHINYGTALVRLGRTNEAAVHYRTAVELAPRDPRPNYATGRALLRMGREAEAIGHLRAALAIDQNHLQSLVHLARISAASPDPELRNGAAAQDLAQRATQLTGAQDSFVLDTLAMAYAEQKRFPEARATLEKALEIEKAKGDSGSVATLEARLSLYRDDKPFRQSPADR